MPFPQGYFSIKSRANNLVLDIPSRESGQSLVVNTRKVPDTDSQLWSFDNGFLINKHSNLVLDIRGGQILSDKQIIQYDRKISLTAYNQLWGYRDGFIHSTINPGLVLDVKGGFSANNTPVILYNRKSTDTLNQQWDFIHVDPTSRPHSPYDPRDRTPGTLQEQPYGYTVGGYMSSDEYRPIHLNTDVPETAGLEEAHRKVYQHGGKVHLSHELIAGAAAFEAIKTWEKREGNHAKHSFAKELISGIAMGEVVKLAEKHNWHGDREEARQAAAMAAQNYYLEHSHHHYHCES